MVHRPWMMFPGRPNFFATASSRWMGIVSPDGHVWRKVWSASKRWSTTKSGTCLRRAGSKAWLGAGSPTWCGQTPPRKNLAKYCSLTTSLFSSRVSAMVVTTTPEDLPWMPITFAQGQVRMPSGSLCGN